MRFRLTRKKPEQDSERIGPGEIARYSFTWKTTNYKPGIHTLRAAILLDNNITLGRTTEEIRFALTPLIISATIVDIAISPKAPRVGEPVALTVTVRNDGPVARQHPGDAALPVG